MRSGIFSKGLGRIYEFYYMLSMSCQSEVEVTTGEADLHIECIDRDIQDLVASGSILILWSSSEYEGRRH